MTGRPEHVPSDGTRNAVEIAAGGNRTLEEIAATIDVDTETLKKHYRQELTKGAKRRRVSVVIAMYNAALKGSVPAQRGYLGLADDATEGSKRGRPRNIDKRGKKEIRRDDAMKAGDDNEWGGDLKPPPGILQ